MKKNRYYIVDVFAIQKYAGNQLAVVLMSENIGDDEMRKIADEFHFSETAFITSTEKRDGGYDVRIFTPREEVPFAGHPTLGTAYIIRNEIEKNPGDTINLNLKAGRIPVSFESGGSNILWMKQINPVFGETFDAKRAAGIIGLDEGDVDERFPVQEVSTGLPFIIIPLKNLKAVKKACTVREAQIGFFKGRTPLPVFFFSPETYSRKNDLNARMFAEFIGIPEDPATGSACGCLAGYLVKYKYFGGNAIDILVEQGYEIGRESILHLRAKETSDGIDVRVGGEVFKVAEGVLW